MKIKKKPKYQRHKGYVQIISKQDCPACPPADSYFSQTKKFKYFPKVDFSSEEAKKFDKHRRITSFPTIIHCKRNGKCNIYDGFNQQFWDTL